DPASLSKPDLVLAVTSQLGALIGQHDTLASQYQTDLQSEYDFYVSTARAPELQTAIVQAASLTTPAALSAITYDLSTVQTQLAQEAAIVAAEAAAAAAPPPPVTVFVAGKKVTFHAPVGGVITQPF